MAGEKKERDVVVIGQCGAVRGAVRGACLSLVVSNVDEAVVGCAVRVLAKGCLREEATRCRHARGRARYAVGHGARVEEQHGLRGDVVLLNGFEGALAVLLVSPWHAVPSRA